MKQSLLSIKEILKGYDVVSKLYPHVPPMTLWRAFEYAAYTRYKLPNPLLDIGCGDGAFLKLVSPKTVGATGIDISADVIEAAKKSGIYSHVYQAAAHQLPVPAQSFASAFANCSLEHMDNLPGVLSSVYNSLQPGGVFLLSVVTEKFIEWSTLPLLLTEMGELNLAQKMLDKHIDYHHLVNPLPVSDWKAAMEKAGFEVADYIPIIPQVTTSVFLFLDNVWHIENAKGETGTFLHNYFQKIPNFPVLFRHIFQSMLEMETNWEATSGAVFLARKSK